MLVSLGAALFVLGSVEADQSKTGDITRIVQGIITGIGFLGAGEIFATSRSESGSVKIKGLTSAAAIWVSASLGVIAALGLWFIGAVGILLTYTILQWLKKVEKRGLKP